MVEKGSVSVKRSITFVPTVKVDDLEGEDKVSHKNSSTSDDLTPDELPNKPLKLSPLRTPPPKPVPMLSAPCPQHIQKPTQYVCNIHNNMSSSNGKPSQLAMPIGLQVPPQETRQGDRVSSEGEIVEMNDEDVTLVVDTGDIEPLELKSLTEVK